MTREELLEAARHLQEQGVPATEIGPRLGRSASWWTATRRRLGLPPAPRRHPGGHRTVTIIVSPEERDRIREQAGAAEQSVSDWLRRKVGLD